MFKKLLPIIISTVFIFTTIVLAQETPEEPEEPVETSATISVIVQTASAKRVAGINISVEGNGFNSAKNTDSNGTASFEVSAEGQYNVKINLSEGSTYELTTGEAVAKTVNIELGDEKSVFYGIRAKAQQEEPEEEEIDINIPAKFYSSGSETTKLENIKKNDLKSLSNFTLHVPNVSKIVFTGELDLSSDEAIDKLKKLDQYVFMNNKGEIAIASDLFPELDKPAQVTLLDLNYVDLGEGYAPVILEDDQVSSTISNIKLNGNSVVTFNVEGFSTYSLQPNIVFDETSFETDSPDFLLTGMIDDLDAEFTVFVNDTLYDEVDVTITEDGRFEIPLVLENEENQIDIQAKGVSEQSVGKEIEIVYTQGEETPSENNASEVIMLIIIVLLILASAGAGGFYYYQRRKKQKEGKQSKPETGPTKPRFDSRLLTDEEKEVYFKNDKPQAKVSDPKEDSKKEGKEPKM